MFRWLKARTGKDAPAADESSQAPTRPATVTGQEGPMPFFPPDAPAMPPAAERSAYPYDQPNFSPVVADALACLRIGKPWTPVRAISQHIRDDMPADLQALLHTFACHGGLIDLGAWVIEARALDVDPFEVVGAAQLPASELDDFDPNYAICLGHDVRGKRPLFAIFAPPKNERMRLAAIDAEEHTTIHFGNFDALIRRVAQEHEKVFGADARVPGLLTRLAEVERSLRRGPSRH